MGSVITGILTDASLRKPSTVEKALIDEGYEGAPWH